MIKKEAEEVYGEMKDEETIERAISQNPSTFLWHVFGQMCKNINYYSLKQN